MRCEESMKEALDCRLIPCEEKEGSSLEMRREGCEVSIGLFL